MLSWNIYCDVFLATVTGGQAHSLVRTSTVAVAFLDQISMVQARQELQDLQLDAPSDTETETEGRPSGLSALNHGPGSSGLGAIAGYSPASPIYSPISPSYSLTSPSYNPAIPTGRYVSRRS